MCGIFGFASSREINLEKLKKILNYLNHRGPDNTGTWINNSENIFLGHKRLSIIDIEDTGNQPMLSNSGRFVISYNGEIYNFKELRKNLEKEGLKYFRGSSDTEVLLNSIELHGLNKTLSLIDGMFAFAIYDKKTNILSLCRDRFGEKPLYYGLKYKNFFFSSELKPLKEIDFLNLEINNQAINLYFKFGYIPHPHTIYSDVFKVEPGQIVNYSCKDQKIISKNKYYDLKNVFMNQNKKNKFQNENTILNSFENKLSENIFSRTVSDVGYGVFLSSGIDSSLIASILAKKHDKKIDTFSIGLKNNLYDEAKGSKIISKHLNTNHNELIIDHKDLLNTIPELSKIYDEPFADSSQIPSIILSKFASKSKKVCLTGDGGDEVFGGYNRHKKIDYFYNLNNSIKIILSKIIDNFNHPQYVKTLYNLIKFTLPPNLKSGIPSEHLDKINLVIKSSSKIQAYERLNSIFQNHELNNLLSNKTQNDDYFNNFKSEIQFTKKIQYYDFINYLPNDILCKLDRASMNYSLETRAPYLNHKFVEYYLNLPENYTINNKISKYLPKKLLSKYLPGKILNLPKRGFGIPLDEWLRGPLKKDMEDILFKKNIYFEEFFNKNYIESIYSGFIKYKNNHHKLWTLIIFQLWSQNYFNN